MAIYIGLYGTSRFKFFPRTDRGDTMVKSKMEKIYPETESTGRYSIDRKGDVNLHGNFQYVQGILKNLVFKGNERSLFWRALAIYIIEHVSFNIVKEGVKYAIKSANDESDWRRGYYELDY